jgi:uncharacterized protein YkwD
MERQVAKGRRSAFLMVVALIALMLSPSLAPRPASAGPENPGGDEARFVSLINAARAKQGLAPLQVDGQLTSAARSWASQMAGGTCGQREVDGRNAICHAGSLSAGVSADWLKLGENVGMGGDVDAVMQGFLNSPPHYENLMDPDYTRIGVGVVWSENGALYTTHRFMRVAGESAPSNDAPAPQGGEKAAPSPPKSQAPKSGAAAPSATAPPPPPTTTTVPPPPVAQPSRVSVVLHALHSASR